MIDSTGRHPGTTSITRFFFVRAALPPVQA